MHIHLVILSNSHQCLIGFDCNNSPSCQQNQIYLAYIPSAGGRRVFPIAGSKGGGGAWGGNP